MSDSIELYNGSRNIQVNTLDVLREPNQQLANAIATGPQDEFFSILEECNRCFTGDSEKLSVTPSWNWRPGTLDMIKKYAAKQLMLDKKSSGLGKYLSRTQENARYRISWLARKLEQCEDKKRMLKREGYQLNVDIEEYIGKLTDFCNTIEESINQAELATNNKVKFIPYIHIPENNERDTTFYIDCYLEPGEMNVYQDETLIQRIPRTGLKLIFECSLRKMMKYLDKPSGYNLAVQYRGINDAKVIATNSYSSCQTTFHPYISQPSRDYDGNRHQWSTACFSSFTDNIRESFHKLNYVVLAMELLEWSGYYNTTHSNPYNNIVLSHFGMPKKYSRAYQAVSAINSQNCGQRLRGNIFDEESREFTQQNIEDKIKMTDYCKEIGCMWKDNCGTYIDYERQLKRVSNEDYKLEIESILGCMLEYFGESRTIEVLYEDFGCYFDDSLVFTNEFNKKVINNYGDVINLIAMRHASIQEIEYLLNEIDFWHLQSEPVADVVVDEDKIKREMLQWATERSI